MKQLQRARIIRGLIGRLEQRNFFIPVRLSSYAIARHLGCSPQTVTNTLLKHGHKVGIDFKMEQHRPNVEKRMWGIAPVVREKNGDHSECLKEYRKWQQEQLAKLDETWEW